jgi:hypothetical protein
MEFYTLINSDSEIVLADIIEFPNGQFAFYSFESEKLYVYGNKQEMLGFIDNMHPNSELIKEGVYEMDDDEKIQKAMNLLYSA